MKGHMIEHNVPVQRRLFRIRFCRFRFLMQNGLNTLHGHQAFACIAKGTSQLTDGKQELAHIVGEHHQRAYGDFSPAGK